MATLTKRQKQLLDYLNAYIGQFGYAPTLAEIGSYFGLSSLATIHKHLKNLEAKGCIKRKWNHSRALEMVDNTIHGVARELPMLGYVAAGTPIESPEGNESITVPDEFIRRQNTFCLRVRGESMVDEGIRDGDYIIVEGREVANDGETVVALVNGEATVKKFFREHDGRIRLEPANVTMQPIYASEEDLRVRGVVVGLMRHYR
ncbi:MAG TPA: transcriptional repressor LexA [Candidatus Binataceae bacterium]|jgi:repressor LexA|nr:transcriptional repressor LexA [Candidatus Binataceae bacterium]